MSGIRGALGLTWGDESAVAAARLGSSCPRWEPWEGGGGFEACFDGDHPREAFGQPCLVRLIRRAGRIEAVELFYSGLGGLGGTALSSIRETAIRELKLEAGDENPYQIFRDGSVVRLQYDRRDDSATLTAGSPGFGQMYQAHLLRGGLQQLGAELRGPR